MRIIFSHDIFQAQQVGGISRYFVELFREFMLLGVDFNLMGSRNSNRLLEIFLCEVGADKADRLILGSNPQIEERSHSRMSSLLRRLISERAYAKISKQIPAVHHRTYFPPIDLCRPSPSVTTLYDMREEALPYGLRDKLFSVVKRRSVESSDHIIAISEFSKQQLMRFWGVPESRISVIHLGLNFTSSVCWQARSL